MTLNRKPLCATLLALFAALGAFAGDVNNFKDLGFSPDGAVYMYGEYGVEGSDLIPWARLSIVDIAKNDFVSGGRLAYKHTDKIVALNDGEGALLAIVGQNPAITEKYRFNYLEQGVPLYITLKNSPVFTPGLNTESIDFRDFDRGDSYAVTLNCFSEGEGEAVQSSFYITVKKTASSGKVTTYRVGSPDIKRNASSYSIKKVTYRPESASMIFVVEMRCPSTKQASSTDIRYMVEALQE